MTLLTDLVNVEPLSPGADGRGGPPIPPKAASTSFFARFLDRSGGSFAGTKLRIRLPDGSCRPGVLDDDSSWHNDNIPGDGTVIVEFPHGLTANPSALRLDGFAPRPADPRIEMDAETFSAVTGTDHTVIVERENFIELVLRGLGASPLEGVECHARTPDGTVHCALSGTDGVVRFEKLPIDVQTCEITVRGIRREQWRVVVR